MFIICIGIGRFFMWKKLGLAVIRKCQNVYQKFKALLDCSKIVFLGNKIWLKISILWEKIHIV